MRTTKVCPKCNTEKDLENDFYNLKTAKSGKYSYCKTCANELSLKYQREHHEHMNEYKRNKMQIPQYYLAHKGRSYIRQIIRGIRENYKFIVECGAGSKKKFMKHMISTIPSPYTIEDYGPILCVDHIIPCAKFDLTDPKQWKKCFHYKNLRLITKSENAAKGAK